MSDKKLKQPKIRFKQFTGENADPWEQRKLNDVCDSFEYGLNAAAKPYDGKNKYVRITDIDDESRRFLDANLTSPDIDLNGADNYLLKNGDILFARTGASVGKSYIYKENDGLVYYAGFLIRARVKPEYDAEFVFQNTLTSKYDKYIKVTSQRSGQPGVNAQEYASFNINVPNQEEQHKIGLLFNNIDNLIALHQRELDNTKTLKQTMLSKMFPKDGVDVPEFRFAGFTDPWEQRKLGEISTFINGRAYKQNELLDQGKYKVLRVGNFYTNDSWYYSDLDLGDKYYAEDGDLLYTWSATFGPHIWHGTKVIYHYHIWKVELSNELEKNFAVHLLEYDKAKITSDKNGSTMVHITKKGMENKNVLIPSIQEQKKISAMLNRIDDLITLHQRELETYQTLKQTMLDKMFI